jgi:hypothetical protein
MTAAAMAPDNMVACIMVTPNGILIIIHDTWLKIKLRDGVIDRGSAARIRASVFRVVSVNCRFDNDLDQNNRLRR